MKQLTKKTIQEIIEMRKRKLSLGDISKRLNVSKTSICKYIHELGISCKKKKCRRPKKFSNDISSFLISQFKKNKIEKLTEGKEVIRKRYKIDCVKQTIKNYLNENGLKCFIKTKKPLLTKKHKEKRLDFAKKFCEYSFFDWNKIIWSDECMFALINTNRKEFYWKSKRDPLNEAHIKKTLKFGGGSITAWGCITSQGVGELIKINGIMDADKYIKILSAGLLKTMENYSLNDKMVIFMHDNDPKHTAKKTKEWIKMNKINVLDWPAQSPDLNPIENLWDIIDRKLRRRDIKLNNKEELWEAVKREWYSLDKEIIRNLYLSMTKRIDDLLKSKGGYTKR
jgi:transposase/predicted transcriptional regulator